MEKQNKGLLDNITNIYVLLFDPYVSGTSTLLVMLVKRKELLRVIKLLYDIDKKFKSLRKKPTYLVLTTLSWGVAVVIPTGIASWAIHMYVIRKDFLTHLLWRLCFAPCYIMYNYFMSIFAGSLIFLYQRFRLLNETIRVTKYEKFHAASILLPKESGLHYQLCEAANSLIKLTALPVLLLSLKVYLTTIVCVLSFYGMVPQMHSELTVWMSIYWIHFLLNVGLCELISVEVFKTKKVRIQDSYRFVSVS